MSNCPPCKVIICGLGAFGELGKRSVGASSEQKQAYAYGQGIALGMAFLGLQDWIRKEIADATESTYSPIISGADEAYIVERLDQIEDWEDMTSSPDQTVTGLSSDLIGKYKDLMGLS